MRLAVKFYGDLDKKERLQADLPALGMPDLWPVQVLELKDEQEMPWGFTLMQKFELAAYQKKHAQDYQDWYAALPKEQETVDPDTGEVITPK